MLAMCLYTPTAMKTTNGMHVVIVLLAGGQIGFLYHWSKLWLLMIITFYHYFCTTNWVSHWLRTPKRNDHNLINSPLIILAGWC
jgi:hypothetical protein